ncbi:type 1 glutamine amidotransferase [Fluviibacterium sp. DFM31]|uniref:Type 1 glutamine amidotransferase n=1 Tax=Meridianimarinicoccus marinus TaxID=3231483 RepID=A0ABV3L5X0_9RHOB
MKIGILQTGETPESFRDRLGDYNVLCQRCLEGQGFTFQTYRVLDGELPPSVQAADGWLITGSRHGVYDDLPWIVPLEDFLRAAYAAAVPIVGICFGHQILAQALGGRVEKFSGGWSVGPVDYRLTDGSCETLIAWHQDQVIEPPAEAQVLASSDMCRNAMLLYGDRALTVQPHPEFTPEFAAALLEARRNVLPAEAAARAEAGQGIPTTAPHMLDRIAAFFRAAAARRTTA